MEADLIEELPKPVLACSTDVRIKLAEWLPFGLRYTSDLSLVFSTSLHGRSLPTLYDKLSETSSKHTVMLIEVVLPAGGMPSLESRLIIGMYASEPWRSSPKIYGNGQCFLFRFVVRSGGDLGDKSENAENGPQGDVAGKILGNFSSAGSSLLDSEHWKWTPPPAPPSNTRIDHLDNSNRNIYNNNTIALWETFQRSDKDSLRMGISEDGVDAGLLLNFDLTKGASHRAVGFDNDPLVMKNDTTKEAATPFDVGLVEVYQLVREFDGLPIR